MIYKNINFTFENNTLLNNAYPPNSGCIYATLVAYIYQLAAIIKNADTMKDLDTIKQTTEAIIKSLNDTVVTKSTKITYDLAQNQNESIPLIVLEYLKVLVWPLIILILISIFKKQVQRLFDRIINESDEIGSSVLGLHAKFRREVKNLVTDTDTSQELKAKIENTLKQNSIDEFKLLSSYFFTKSFQARKQAAAEIYKLAQNLNIDDLLSLILSPLAGERVGAFVGIKSHIDNFPNIAKDERISEAIRIGLDDGYSRVRYRVVQAISSSDYLMEMFGIELKSMLEEENNMPVKNEINDILKRLNKDNNC